MVLALASACGPQTGETTAATDIGTATDGAGSADTGGATATPTTTGAGACPGGPATSTGGSAIDMEGLCPDHVAVDACCCFDPTLPGQSNYAVVCGQRFLCQEIVLPGGVEGVDLEACAPAIDCALAALAAGDTGTIRWRVPNDFGQDTIQIHLVGDGTAFRAVREEGDGGWVVAPVERYALHEASLFASCAKSTNLDDRVACLLRALEGEASEMCTPGQGHSDF